MQQAVIANGLVLGQPPIRSAGPIAFAPDGTLFFADNEAATIFAIDLGSEGESHEARAINVEQLDSRLGAYLGCAPEDLFIRSMAVRPQTQAVYLSVARGTGDAAIALLVRVNADGSLKRVVLDSVPFASIAIEGAPAADDARSDVRLVVGDREGELRELKDGRHIRISRDPMRTVTVTDLQFADGAVLVAGASNEEFSSTLRRIPFPFTNTQQASSLEIFHVSHGKYETASPIRTFVPYANGKSILASYTCTPVVRFELDAMLPGAHVAGSTVAELGSVNTPLDMVSYRHGGGEYLLVSNTDHSLIKIACADIDRQDSLTQPGQPVGAPREELAQPGVGLMAVLNDEWVLMMQHDADGGVSLRSYACEAL